MKLHIFGSSGSGTTSLAQALGAELGLAHFDCDNYYWEKTDIPFTVRSSVAERQRRLLLDLKGLEGWIISGSMDAWSEPFVSLFDGVIFVTTSPEIRVKRLRDRELNAYGDRIKPGGDMFEVHDYFIRWAEQYERGELPGRSLARHEEWIKTLDCPILRVDNSGSFDELLVKVKNWLSSLKSSTLAHTIS